LAGGTMSNELKFLAYCVEIYKSAKKMSGEAAYSLFEKYNALDYIKECYGALHTTSAQYTIDNIDEFISRQHLSEP
jgi:hypothetical protein